MRGTNWEVISNLESELLRQDLDRHVPAELQVLRLIDLPHTSLAQLRGNFIVRERFPDHGTGNRCLSSSNQFRITLSWCGTEPGSSRIIRNRFPSGETS
jgi:hypothetical protein